MVTRRRKSRSSDDAKQDGYLFGYNFGSTAVVIIAGLFLLLAVIIFAIWSVQ